MERELVERAMAGDHDAFGALAHEVAGRLFVVARLILHDDAEAEDATQDALFMAWRHIRGLRDPDRFDAWVRRLLVNACYRRASTAGRRARIQIGLRAIRSEPDASARLADRDEIERGFRRLALDERAALVLHYYVGLQADELAQALGVPRGTARSRLHRARASLRAALEADARAHALIERRAT